jgi:hypothetical protein
MRYPHHLDNKEYLTMAEFHAVQRKAEQFLAWIGTTQPATLLKYWTPNMEKCPWMM